MAHASIGDTLSTAERDSVVARRKTMSQLATALRTTDQETRAKTMAVLSAEQREKITSLLNGAGPSNTHRRGQAPADGGPPPMPEGTP
jgi:Spy/CpxP family protein refolding chaperone